MLKHAAGEIFFNLINDHKILFKVYIITYVRKELSDMNACNKD